MRRLRALVAGLPRECALLRHMDPVRSQWDTTAELLASLIEVIDFGNRLAWVGHGIQGAAPKPVVVRRPGHEDAAEEEQPLSRESMRAALLGG